MKAILLLLMLIEMGLELGFILAVSLTFGLGFFEFMIDNTHFIRKGHKAK